MEEAEAALNAAASEWGRDFISEISAAAAADNPEAVTQRAAGVARSAATLAAGVEEDEGVKKARELARRKVEGAAKAQEYYGLK